MLFFYIRHGDPIYTPDSLTPKGERQAEALAKRLALHGLDEIYVSTSNRAKLTAQPTCELLKMTPTELDWCHENHTWRDLATPNQNGRRQWIFQNADLRALMVSPEIRALDMEWYRHPRFADTSCEAGMHRIQEETDAFFASLGYVHIHEKYYYRADQPNDRRVALFAHQGFGLAFLSCLLDIPYPMICSHFDMGHTGMTVIEFSDLNGISIPKVLQLSNDSHLYREGLPTDYQNRIRF